MDSADHDQASRSHIQRLPDEVLARLFIVGCWLPGRMSDHDYSESLDMHPLQLKPYAKLVSQVCARWRSIVYWQSNRRELYHAAISLACLGPSAARKTELAADLKAYLEILMKSEDAELDVEWALTEKDDLLVRLFIHGMNLTAPHFHRVRIVKAYFAEPRALAFCFSLLNSIRAASVLTHLKVRTTRYLSGALLTSDQSFMPTCTPFNSSASGNTFNPIAPFAALSDLALVMDVKIMERCIVPANLLHLSLLDRSNSTSWSALWTVILQCHGSLRTLTIDLPESTTLPDLSGNLTINLPYLTELVFVSAQAQDMEIMLPFMITPRLKLLYFRRLVERSTDVAIKSKNFADAWSESSPSQADLVRPFAAPVRLSIRITDHQDIKTFGMLCSSMALDAVEQVWIEYLGYNRSNLLPNDNPDFAPLRRTRRVLFLVQAVSTLFGQHSKHAKNGAMPEVRVMDWYDNLVYNSSDDANAFSD